MEDLFRCVCVWVSEVPPGPSPQKACGYKGAGCHGMHKSPQLAVGYNLSGTLNCNAEPQLEELLQQQHMVRVTVAAGVLSPCRHVTAADWCLGRAAPCCRLTLPMWQQAMPGQQSLSVTRVAAEMRLMHRASGKRPLHFQTGGGLAGRACNCQ